MKRNQKLHFSSRLTLEEVTLNEEKWIVGLFPQPDRPNEGKMSYV